MNKPIVAALTLCLAPLSLGGCLDDKVLEIVLTGETSAEFSQNEITATWTKPAIIDMADEIGDILEDNGYERADLKQAHVTSAHYGVTSFSQSNDWTISGTITVTYNADTQTIVSYASQSVQDALGEKIAAPLEPGGVDLINQALDDFRSGQNPVLIFTINNGSTTPTPSVVDPMIFDWRAWLAIQVIVDQTVEVPDPF